MEKDIRWTRGIGMQLMLPRVLDYYCTTLELEGKSRKTIEWYSQNWRFFQFLTQSGELMLARDLSLEDVRLHYVVDG